MDSWLQTSISNFIYTGSACLLDEQHDEGLLRKPTLKDACGVISMVSKTHKMPFNWIDLPFLLSSGGTNYTKPCTFQVLDYFKGGGNFLEPSASSILS